MMHSYLHIEVEWECVCVKWRARILSGGCGTSINMVILSICMLTVFDLLIDYCSLILGTGLKCDILNIKMFYGYAFLHSLQPTYF